MICFFSYMLSEPNLAILTVFTPTLLALIISSISGGKKALRALFINQTFKNVGLKWISLSLFVFPILGSLAMLSSSKFDFSQFELRTTQLLPQIIIIVLIGFGEEYGWRGFLQSKINKKTNVLNASLLVGFIWGLWHFPAYMIGTGVPLEMHFGIFIIWVLLASLFIGWIYYKTGNVLTSVLAHISANATFNYLVILPEFTGSMETFSYFMLFLFIMVGFIFYRYRDDLVKLKRSE